MKDRLVLLLTHDRVLQTRMEKALLDSTTAILVARNIPEAMRIVLARWHELDLAVLDLDGDSDGRALLRTIRPYRGQLPVVIAISSDLFHPSPFVYSHRAAERLSKPFKTEQLDLVVELVGKPERALSAD